MSKERVLIARPYIDRPDLESDMAAMCSNSEGKLEVNVYPRLGSLLAYAFNEVWCEFVNNGYDYFAMLHADLYAKGWWVDVLKEEMDKGGFGVMHAVTAIKDDRGSTSTAFGGAFDPPFTLVRRLTTTELHQLPETFGAKDVKEELIWDEKGMPKGWCLLPNTGCMLVRREGFPLRAFKGFCITDEVNWDKDGKAYANTEPEDWAFGRWCGRNGVKVGGTRKVSTIHYGRTGYPNDSAWGKWKTDEHWLAHQKRKVEVEANGHCQELIEVA